MEDFPTISYKVELRLNGKLIGDCRKIAESLTWTKRCTKMGVDAISFTVNDFVFSEWCEERGVSLVDILKPLALDCRIVRNGITMVGGYLATMPAYQPTGHSASLSLQFDGYLNYLAGVFIYPQATETKRMGAMIADWISEANTRSGDAGKSFGFSSIRIDSLPTVTQSYEDYKDIKSYITDRCDNVSGAGEFEVYINPQREYAIIPESSFGGDRTGDYIINYPAEINIVSAAELSVSEVSGFASCVIGIGNGETSGTEADNTAIISRQVNEEAVKEYGYAEATLSESSVSIQETLDRNTATELAQRSSMIWQPEILLSGRQVTPAPPIHLHYPITSDEPTNYNPNHPIWIGDTVAIHNRADFTGMTSGEFRVEELEVAVEATGAETIRPTLSRIGTSVNNFSFAQEFVRMQSEIRALKAKK